MKRGNAKPVVILAVALLCGLASWPGEAVEPGSGKHLIDAAAATAILKRHCAECHGPAKQEGELRLDSLKAGVANEAIVPGKAEESELMRRVTRPRGDAERMPPRGTPLSRTDVETLRAWINGGAEWPQSSSADKHWAYAAPVRPAVPLVRQQEWVKSPIDAFVLARLEREGLAPSAETDRETLIRRVSLDLIGLPPTIAEVDAFIRDTQPDAWERVVDRLLQSPELGVKWARPWLDYARYADSHGFQKDDFRDVWAYRDWVVNALNADMPFAQFTVEQLAGDLLPSPTPSQRIATGFNRCAPTNVEAGTEPEETRVNQVFDRVNTVGMVWLGSTMECCQCHDHKYDPFSLRDYYGLFAFFNNTEIEAERSNPKVPGSIAFRNIDMALENPETDGVRQDHEKQLAGLERQLARRREMLGQPDADWEQAERARIVNAPAIHPLDIVAFESTEGSTFEILPDQSVLLSGEAPDRDTYVITARTRQTDLRGLRIDALTDPSLPGTGPGRGDDERPNFVLTEIRCDAAPTGGGKPQPVVFERGVADFSQKNLTPEKAFDGNDRTGWAINPQFRKPHWVTFMTAKPFGHSDGTELTIRLEQNFGSARTLGRVRLSVVTGSADGPAVPDPVRDALTTKPMERTTTQRDAIAAYRAVDDAEVVRLERQRSRVAADLKKLAAPTTLVMREIAKPRLSTVFQRGSYLTPGEPIEPALPAVLQSTASNTPARSTRLELAQWLASRENPLVARVTVNRWWCELFGQGLVTTPEDFGLKGEPPTHPELLDWLAVEFHDCGGSLKQMLKTIVLSSTYRQSSGVSADLLARDDRNLLYARGPRFRMDAEMVRDNALAVAGLLSLKQGGPPIKPYQPEGLWVKVGGLKYDYEVSPGEDRYRRGLYVVCKRGSPYPSLVNFDANSRTACRVQRSRSNTPIQALTLLNDPVYVEAAKAFAKRVAVDEAGSFEERLASAFQRATSRGPTATELSLLRSLYEAQLADAQAAPQETDRLVGEIVLPKEVSRAQFVAWYAVCAALLNLDETITKG